MASPKRKSRLPHRLFLVSPVLRGKISFCCSHVQPRLFPKLTSQISRRVFQKANHVTKIYFDDLCKSRKDTKTTTGLLGKERNWSFSKRKRRLRFLQICLSSIAKWSVVLTRHLSDQARQAICALVTQMRCCLDFMVLSAWGGFQQAKLLE